jgi:putative membrane protein
MKKIIYSAVLALIAGAANAQSLSQGDQQILSDLAEANIAEVATAQIALRKGQSAEVKQFAQQMVDDHSKGLQEVQKVAQAKNVTLPAEPSAKHKQAAEHLNTLSGAAFDKAYLAEAGVKDHKAAHAAVTSAQKKAQDPDVKALAAKLQPVIDQHLQRVQALNSGNK